MEKEVKYAGFWIRVVAIILDGIVLGTVLYLIQIFISGKMFESMDFSKVFESVEDFTQLFEALKTIVQPMITVWAITVLINILYWVILTGKFGATLGKMALGIKVVKDDLQPVTYRGAFVREFLGKNLLYSAIFFGAWLAFFWFLWSYKNPFSSLIVFVGFLGYLWVSWDKRKQGWHDKIARTVVIKEKSGGLPAEPVIPIKPSETKEPIKPAEPIKPPQPIIPKEPVKSVEPIKPAEPSNQVLQSQRTSTPISSESVKPPEQAKPARTKEADEWIKKFEATAQSKPVEEKQQGAKKVVSFGE